MTPTKTTTTKTATDEPKKKIRHSYLYTVGRRKKAVSRTRLVEKGSGKIIVNEKEYDKYFPTAILQNIITKPLEVVSKLKDYDFSIKVLGGGVRGQAEAARHGIARALVKLDEDFKPLLKAEGLMTRDPRRKERKKPGLKRARRAPQFSKR